MPFCRTHFRHRAKATKGIFASQSDVPAHDKNPGDAMKVLACTICGRNVLVGNATKTVVCAICNSSLADKIKKEQKEREQECRSCANPDCDNTFVPSVPWQRYCCHACKTAAQRSEPRVICCKQCGQPFKGDARFKYCSDECKALAHEASKRERTKRAKERNNEF